MSRVVEISVNVIADTDDEAASVLSTLANAFGGAEVTLTTHAHATAFEPPEAEEPTSACAEAAVMSEHGKPEPVPVGMHAAIEDVRDALNYFLGTDPSDEKKSAARAIFEKYGARTLPDLAEEHYDSAVRHLLRVQHVWC